MNILTVVSLQTKHLQVRVAMYCLRDLFYISLSSLYVSLSSRMDKAFGDRIDGTGMLSLVYNAKAFCKTTGRFKWKSKVWRHCCNVLSFCDLLAILKWLVMVAYVKVSPGGTLQNSPWENLLAGQVRIQVRIEDLIHGVETWNNFV